MSAPSPAKSKPPSAPPAGYSGTPLWKKLGYSAGIAALVIGAPENYRALLTLPNDLPVTWLSRPKTGVRFVHLFATEAGLLSEQLTKFRQTIAADGTLWISWPKKSSSVTTDITEDTIRQLALPLGFVDIKVCAVDATWSGLNLVIRKTER